MPLVVKNQTTNAGDMRDVDLTPVYVTVRFREEICQVK